MNFWLALLFLLPPLALPQRVNELSFQDDLLDHLTGKWNVSGIVHGNRSRQTIEAKWVLHHQFLRIEQRSIGNVANTEVPYEGVFYIGYDDAKKLYIAHLMNVFGGQESEVLGHGKRTGDEITFEFAEPEDTVVQRFRWVSESKTWQIVSWLKAPGGAGDPFLDLKATRAK
jgi:hypothetical protein